MGGKKLTAKSIRRKNEPMHPDSRRAAQLTRAATREAKLKSQKSSRKILNANKVDRIATFVLLLPDDIEALPDLPALHAWVQESWLPRHDDELARLKATRRPGRPPLKEEIALQHRIEAERTEYAAGLDLPDLLSPANVRLLRDWKGDLQSLNAFRFVRISGKFPDKYSVVQEGIHPTLKDERAAQAAAGATSTPTTEAASAKAASESTMETDQGISSSSAPRRASAGHFYNMDGPAR